MKRLLWLSIFLLAVGLAWWGVARALVPTSSWARVEHNTVKRIVSGSVVVAAEQESQIASPGDGIVLPGDYALKEGNLVQAGQLVARLDPGDIPSEIEDAKIKLAPLRIQLDPTNPSHGKLASEFMLEIMQQNLIDKKQELDASMIGKADYEELVQQAAAQQALAVKERSDLETQVKVLENSITNFNQQLARLEIRAPYDGYITFVQAHPGDLLSKGGPVAGIISSALKIQAEVNQDNIAGVFPGEPAEIRFFAYEDKIPATVKLVLPNSDKATQRFTVVLEIANLSSQVAAGQTTGDSPTSPASASPPIQLFAGLAGEVAFIAGEHKNVLTRPRSALLGNGVSGSVFVVKDGRVEVRQVTPKPGYVTLMQAEIGESSDSSQTVRDGDIVLTENLDLFRNGDRVRLVPDPKLVPAGKH